VWSVNNDPVVRAQSISTEPIPWDSHQAWFERSLESPRRRLLIASQDGVQVGVWRLDLDLEGRAEVSLAVHPEHRGRGLGSALIAAGSLAALSEEGGPRTLVAHVRPGNAASRRAFERCAYLEVGRERIGEVELLRYERRRSEAP
jgi:RimJ/RimL family protein N-acetyltransferase